MAKKKANGANGAEIKPAPREGPYINLRFRNREQKREIARRAKAKGVSMNTLVVHMIEQALAQ